MNKLFLSLIFLLLSHSLFAQTIQITGKVTSAEDGQPIPGVTVVEKNTSNGTITNIEGIYNLSIPQGATVVYSFVGMNEEELVINSAGTYDVILVPSVEELDEVVLIGYGTKKKRDIIGSVSSVSSEDLKDSPTATFVSAMQGKAAGVFISSQSGVPGAKTNVQIRGVNTINLNSEPLWVIDGMPIYSGGGLETSHGSIEQDPMSLINVNDIESIEVLKDAKATSIYGSRGTNGVIIITTKSGKKNQSSLNVNYSTGIANLTRQPSDIGFANTSEWLYYIDKAKLNSGLDPFDPDEITNFFKDDPLATLTRSQMDRINTNWFDHILQQGSFHDINVSTTRGMDKGSMFISVNYNNTKSVLTENWLRRLSARTNVDFQPTEYIRMGTRLNFNYSKNTRVAQQMGGATGNNSAGASAGFGKANFDAQTWYPIYNHSHPSGYWNPLAANLVAAIDPDNHHDVIDNYRGIGTLFTEVFIPGVEGLKIRAEGAADIIQNNSVIYVSDVIREEGSWAREQVVTNNNINYNVVGNYDKDFGENHNLLMTAGMEWQRLFRYNRFLEGQNLTGTYQQLGRPSDFLAMSAGLNNEEYLKAYLARVDYKFMDRYLVGLSYRRDGSSKFQGDKKWGDFPAISAGWILSDEEWANFNVLNFLKLRGSFGITGNKNIANNMYTTIVTNNPNDRYGELGLIAGGSRFVNIANPDITWETTENFDIGLDYGIFQNRINGSISYYVRNVSDILLRVGFPPSAGIGYTFDNVGNMRNWGWDFDIHSTNFNTLSGFKWVTDLNISLNQNKVTALTDRYDNENIGIDTGNRTRTFTGGQLRTFFMSDWVEVDPERGVDMIREIDYQHWQETGEYIFTGRLVPATQNNQERNRVPLEGKTSLPTYFGGFTNTFSFKGVSLLASFIFSGGNYLYDYWEQRTTSPEYGQTILRTAIEDHWEEPGDVARYPMLVWRNTYPYGWDTEIPNPEWEGDPDDPRATGYWVEQNTSYLSESKYMDKYLYKADFIRLKTLQLSYSFGQNFTNRLGLGSLMIYVAGANLLTITDFKGWDPETGAQSLPPLKTYTFGVNLSLK